MQERAQNTQTAIYICSGSTSSLARSISCSKISCTAGDRRLSIGGITTLSSVSPKVIGPFQSTPYQCNSSCVYEREEYQPGSLLSTHVTHAHLVLTIIILLLITWLIGSSTPCRASSSAVPEHIPATQSCCGVLLFSVRRG